MCVLAISMQLELNPPDNIQWIAYTRLCSFAFIIFIGNVGLDSMHFIILAEILPNQIKGVGLSLLGALLWILYLIALKFFPYLIEMIGLHGASFAFAAACFICSVIILIYLPETKAKSYEAIMASLRGIE